METHLHRTPILSFDNLSSTSFTSSKLTKLSVVVDSFADCLCLLDGRLNQLSKFTVVIANVKDHPSVQFNPVSLTETLLVLPDRRIDLSNWYMSILAFR